MFRTDFDESDLHSHQADEGDLMWQESFCIVWHDPITGSGGNHHFSLWRNQGIADIWSWVVLDGEEIAREQVHDIPIPDEDYADTRIGGMHATCGGDFAHYNLVHTFEDCTVTIGYAAYVPPVELDYASGGASLGKRHFETLGTVEVRIEKDGEVRDLTGVAFHDHSWGHRELERNPAGQFMFAVFGPDLMASAYLRLTVDGPSQDGWVYDHGKLKRIRSATMNATIANDGLYARRSVCDVWTDDGGLRVNGEFQLGAVEGGIGLLAGDAMMIFECGGRLGAGMVELKPLRFALPEHRALLRLPD